MKRFFHALGAAFMVLSIIFLVCALGAAIAALQAWRPDILALMFFGGIFTGVFVWAWLSYEDKP